LAKLKLLQARRQVRTQRYDVQVLIRGRLTASFAENPDELSAAQALRHLRFRSLRGLAQGSDLDQDRFDPLCRHMLIHDGATLVACYRLLPMPDARAVLHSYSAQFYDLSRLACHPGPLLELGRFCLHPGHADPDILRLAWAALTQVVDQTGVQLLFGCSSFDGADPAPHLPALAHLAARHLAPPDWAPVATMPGALGLRGLAAPPDPTGLPPLLRSYLGLGGWVSDHAVIDQDLNTLHVFTGLAIAAVPAARARALRAIAG
jgi:L-ornithine Nalpha-acyltransferase